MSWNVVNVWLAGVRGPMTCNVISRWTDPTFCFLPTYPENHDEGKEAEQVYDHDHALDRRHFVDGKYVEQDRENFESDRKQRSMPALGHVVRVTGGNESDDLEGGGVGDGRHCSLPT